MWAATDGAPAPYSREIKPQNTNRGLNRHGCDCRPDHAVRSNPVSDSLLQKTGILPKTRRDFRHSRPKTSQSKDAETFRLRQVARERRAFSRQWIAKLQRPDWL